MFHRHADNHGSGWSRWLTPALLIAAGAGLAYCVQSRRTVPSAAGPNRELPAGAFEDLKELYASGEISTEEYKERKDELHRQQY